MIGQWSLPRKEERSDAEPVMREVSRRGSREEERRKKSSL